MTLCLSTPILWFGDASLAYQLAFQDPATTTMEGIYLLLNLHLLFIVVSIVIITGWSTMFKEDLLQIQVSIFLNLPRIFFFLRIIMAFLVVITSSPEYTYCMNQEIENVPLPNLLSEYGYSRSVSNIKFSVWAFQLDLETLKDANDKESIRPLLDPLLNSVNRLIRSITSVQNTLELWNDIGSIVENPEDYVTGSPGNQKKIMLDKLVKIEDNRLLRERIGAANWTLSSICAATAGVVLSTVFILAIGSKNI